MVIYPHHRLDTFRGCVANSREWLFFVYNRSDVGGTLYYMLPLDVEKDLPLILGLLRDWVRFDLCSFCHGSILIFILDRKWP